MAAFIALTVMLLAAGVLTAHLGRRGRRINDHPICASCRFDLIGVYPQSKACPECGSDLKPHHAVRAGARRANRPLLATGILLIVLSVVIGGGGLIATAAGINWNKHLPTWILIARAQSAGQSDASDILAELNARSIAGTLSRKHVDSLIQATLARQRKRATLPWDASWGDLFMSFVAGGHVSDEDYATYLRQSVSIQAQTRTQAHPNPELPFQLRLATDRGAGISPTFLEVALSNITIDGRPVEPPGRGYSRMSLQGTDASSTITTRLPLAIGTGDHTIQSTWNIRAIESLNDSAPEITAWQHTCTSTINIVPEDEPLVLMIEDPDAARIFRDNCRIVRVSATRMDGDVYVEVELRSTIRPVAVAMDLFLLADGREWYIDSFTMPRQRSHHNMTLGKDATGLDARAVTVELRPSIEAAEKAIGYKQILDEVIRYEDVKVQWQE